MSSLLHRWDKMGSHVCKSQEDVIEVEAPRKLTEVSRGFFFQSLPPVLIPLSTTGRDEIGHDQRVIAKCSRGSPRQMIEHFRATQSLENSIQKHPKKQVPLITEVALL